VTWIICICGIAQQSAISQFTELEILKGVPDPSISGSFGWAIAVDGSIAAVAAVNESGGEINSGVVYIFERQGTTWIQQARLRASNSGSGDQFGISLDLSGDTLVVGAIYEDSNSNRIDHGEDDNSANDSGAAYVYVRDSSGTWSQQAYLKASSGEGGGGNPFLGDHFGRSVAICGDTIAISATGEDSGLVGEPLDNSASSSGAVYIFTRDGEGKWTEQDYIKSPLPDQGDGFGTSLGLDGDHLVVGALGEDALDSSDQSDNSLNSSGAAFAYERREGEWEFAQFLKAPNADAGDLFGRSLAIGGDTLVVAATMEDSSSQGINGDMADNNSPDSGAVYVYERTDKEGWSFRTYIKAHNSRSKDNFGTGLAIGDDSIIIGAPQTEAFSLDGSNLTGVAYRIARDPEAAGGWRQRNFLTPSNNLRNAAFGFGVAVSGGAVFATAPRESSFSGSTYVFGAPAEFIGEIESINLLPNGTLRLKIPIAIGRDIGLEYSRDLQPGSWIELGNFFESNGEATFVDTDFFRLDRGSGFYRAFLRP